MKLIIVIFLMANLFQSCQGQSKVDKILSDNSDEFELIMEIFNLMPDDFESLNQYQKNLFFVSSLEGQVGNGGFSQYFFNGSGEYAHEALIALKEIKANKTAELLNEAISIFPKLPIPKDSGDRREIMDELPDEIEEKWDMLDTEFYKKKDNLDGLMVKYVIQHKDKFE